MEVEHEHDNGFSVGAPMDDTVSTGRGSLSIGTRMYISRVPIYEAVSGHPPATWTPTPTMPMPPPPPPPPCVDKATGRRRMSAKQRERSVSTAKVAAKVKGMLQEIEHVRRDRKMVRFGGEESNAASGSGGGEGRRSSRSILKGYVSLVSGG